MIRLSGILILSFFCSWARAQEEPVYLPVEWQRVELQGKILAETEKSLSAIIDKNKFLIQVRVNISEAKTFGEKNKADNATFGLDKLGINKNSKAYQKAMSVGTNTVFDRIQSVVVDLSVDNSVAGEQSAQAQKFIAAIVKSYVNAAPSIRVARIQFLQQGQSDEKIHKQNLEVANVNIEAANKLAEAIQSSNTQLSESIKAMGAALTGKEYKQNAQEVRQLPRDWQAIVLEFKMELGILLATILILIFFSGFKSIEGQKVALMAQANRQAKEATDVSVQSGGPAGVIETPAASAAATGDSNVTVGTKTSSAGEGNGFVQFASLAQMQPQVAAYFVKMWLNMGTLEASEAVAFLPKVLPLETLSGVYSNFSDDIKNKLRKASLTPLGENSASRADDFIVQQLVNNFLVNTVTLSEEVKALTSSMTLKEYIECMSQDPKICGVLMNTLQVEQLGRILNQIPDDAVNEFLDNGLKFTSADTSYLEQKLSGLLSGMRKDSEGFKVPLLNQSQELIKLLGPSREKDIFGMLASSGDTQQLMEAAKAYFPSELLLKFSPEFLRVFLNQVSPALRAELIFSRPVDEQALFLKAVGDTGRMREMIDLELKQISGDEKRKSQLERDQHKIWSQFVFKARSSILTNAQLKAAADSLLKKWLEDKGVEAYVDSAA